MTDQELVKQAQNLHLEAHELLFEKGLFDLLSRTGLTQVIGSYAMDLMTWRDLDINLQLPDAKDIVAFFELGKTIVIQFNAYKVTFSNQFIRPDVPFDHGLFLRIRLPYLDQEWKIDLWGYGKEAYQDALEQFRRVSGAIEPKHRMIILRIKDEICRRPEYRRDVYSVDIYRAVVEDGINDWATFNEWLCFRKKFDDGSLKVIR